MSKFNIGNCTINVQRLSLHPCSLDEYELKVKDEANTLVYNTLADCFTSDEKLANEAYKNFAEKYYKQLNNIRL